MEEKLMELLNDYYGESKNESYKREICEFIDNYKEDIYDWILDTNEVVIVIN